MGNNSDIINHTLQTAHFAAILNFNWLLILRWYQVKQKIILCHFLCSINELQWQTVVMKT